jgi:hypothetical protein
MSDENRSVNYCSKLCNLVDNVNIVKNDNTFLGFFVPRLRKRKITENASDPKIIPSAILLRANDNLNTSWIQSWECYTNQYEKHFKEQTCKICKLFLRGFRGLDPKPMVSLFSYNKLMRQQKNETLALNAKIDQLKEYNDKLMKNQNKIKNKLRKQSAYWKNECKILRKKVGSWRQKEHRRKGFITTSESDSLLWFQFYTLICELVEKEHAGDFEKIALHKELIRSKYLTLGKFN